MARPHDIPVASDIKAGLTVGVVLVPQAIAYAILAGMPAVYGLYASLVPLVVYAALGSSPQLAVGVNAIDMLVIAAGVAPLAAAGSDEYVTLVILLAAVVGVIQVVMGLLRLGFIVNLLSRPVVTGFVSGAALIIALNQLRGLLGIRMPGSSRLHILLLGLFKGVDTINVFTALIGIASVVLIIGLKRIRPRFPAGLTAAILATLAVWLFDLTDLGVSVVGAVPHGLPWPKIPAISTGNVVHLLPTAGMLALFQFMTVVSLGRAGAVKEGYRVFPNREFSAIGAANFVGSFFHGIPVSGSFSRTSILLAFGRTTRLANALAAFVVGFTILFLTPLFAYVPDAVLSAIIIVAISKLVDWQEALYLLRVKRVDGLIAVITFVTTIFLGVVLGIAIGVGASVFAVMYRLSRPHVAVLGHVPGTRSYRDVGRNKRAQVQEGVLMIRLDASFSFANAEYVREKILGFCRKYGGTRFVVLDGSGINDLDMTAAAVLVDIAKTLSERDIQLYVTGLKGPVRDTVRGTKLESWIGKDHLVMSPYRAMKLISSQLEAEGLSGAISIENPD